MNYKSSLAQVRGLGSAKTGTHHWWYQRVSSVALVPLSFWFVTWLNLLLHAPYQEVVNWLKSPLHSVAIIAWLIVVFYHAALGLQVVIEDYVSNDGIKIPSIWVVKLLLMFSLLTAIMAVLRITFTG